MYIPQTVVFNASKIDFDNEKHVKLLSFKLKQIGLALDGDKVKSNLKPKKVYKLQIICSYINGAEEMEITEDMLTANQREAISLGLKKLEDFRTGSVFGNRITEYRLVDFNLRGDYEDGCIILDDSISEFEENIYIPEKEESVDELEKSTKKSDPESESVSTSDDEDLFS